MSILAALWQPHVCERWSAVVSAPTTGNVMDTVTSVRVTDSTYLLTITRRTKPNVSTPLTHKPCEWSASRLGSFTSVAWVLDTHWKEIIVCPGASLDTLDRRKIFSVPATQAPIAQSSSSSHISYSLQSQRNGSNFTGYFKCFTRHRNCRILYVSGNELQLWGTFSTHPEERHFSRASYIWLLCFFSAKHPRKHKTT